MSGAQAFSLGLDAPLGEPDVLHPEGLGPSVQAFHVIRLALAFFAHPILYDVYWLTLCQESPRLMRRAARAGGSPSERCLGH